MYYIIYPIFYVLSLLPWWFMYLISDAIFGLLYYVIGYRKAVVHANLQIAFPNKSEAERKAIAKQFYHQFVDSFIETIKLISISPKAFDKRCQIDCSLLHQIHNTGQSMSLLGGHFFGWEFVNLGISKNYKGRFIGVYMPLSNKAFDQLILKIRGKYNSTMLSVPDFRTNFHQYTKEVYALGLAADQKPSNPNKAFWLPFFNKLTPFYTGPEKGALRLNNAVIMTNFYPVKRGYYKIDFTLLTTTPKQTSSGYITKELIRFIEEKVQERPANYLWTHKRWKVVYNEAQFGHLVIH